MKVQCCKCKRMKLDGRWQFARVHIHEAVSHGYCPDCADATRLEFFCELASQASKSGILDLNRILNQPSATA